jgi:hypothetical protein
VVCGTMGIAEFDCGQQDYEENERIGRWRHGKNQDVALKSLHKFLEDGAIDSRWVPTGALRNYTVKLET